MLCHDVLHDKTGAGPTDLSPSGGNGDPRAYGRDAPEGGRGSGSGPGSVQLVRALKRASSIPAILGPAIWLASHTRLTHLPMSPEDGQAE